MLGGPALAPHPGTEGMIVLLRGIETGVGHHQIESSTADPDHMRGSEMEGAVINYHCGMVAESKPSMLLRKRSAANQDQESVIHDHLGIC